MGKKMAIKTRKHLSAHKLFGLVRSKFSQIKDKTSNRPRKIPLVDYFMSGLAMFSLKYPSLLQFDTSAREECVKRNLNNLFGVAEAPCDTNLREELDKKDPRTMRKSFTAVFAQLQRAKALEPFKYFKDCYLFSMDGTGFFSSHEIHCESCCVKEHKNGTKTYYHQMLCGALVHPEQRVVIPFAPEPILKQDGVTKNDCERNAAKRLLADLKREHPHLKLIIIEDGLASNGPHIALLKELGMHFILGAKPKDHTFMFDYVNQSQCEFYETVDEAGTIHRYRFVNEVPLNEANKDLKVNFLEYWEIKENGKTQHFTWVTDFKLVKDNVEIIMRGGRTRWKIENETFNTLKNQGYHFEHNFGHGHKNLSTVFAFLMMLAFFIDQAQALVCPVFKKALKKTGTKVYLWKKMQSLFFSYSIDSWMTLFESIIYGHDVQPLSPNTS